MFLLFRRIPGLRLLAAVAAIGLSCPAPALEGVRDAHPASETALGGCPTTMGSTMPSGALPALAPAQAAALRQSLEKKLGDISSICRTPFGLLEVVADGDFYYVDEHATYLLKGNAFDLRTHENLTSTREDEVLRVDIHALPLNLAVKTVKGKGSRVLVIFEDPNCPYCKRFEKDMAALDDVTTYTFLYPILSRDRNQPDDSYAKSRAIWCSADRAQAWAQVMLEGRRLTAGSGCEAPLEQVLKLGHGLHVTATPTLIFASGHRVPGAIPLDEVQKELTERSQSSSHAAVPGH
jgi:thiol:disulfide interchange protein DsbC